MFISCPHCRDLVATDRETRLPPALCPRCGGVLRETDAQEATPGAAVGTTPSFASFLRGGETADSDSDSTETETAAPVEISGEPTPEQETPGAAAMQVEEDAGPITAFDESPAIESDAAEPAPPVASRTAPAAVASDPAPSFMRAPVSTATPSRTAKWQWAAVFVLASLLVIQVLVADRARLAADAGWRPTIITLCGLLGCSVPAWHQPGAIAMLSRDVSPIAGSPGGLDVRATFRNDARWPQPWPVLLLSLSDADGRMLGSRAFTPREYLGADAAQTELAPGQSARIALKLHEPNPDVVAFSFDFR